MFVQCLDGKIYVDPVWHSPAGQVKIVDGEFVLFFKNLNVLPFKSRIIKVVGTTALLVPKSPPGIPDHFVDVVQSCADTRWLVSKVYKKETLLDFMNGVEESSIIPLLFGRNEVTLKRAISEVARQFVDQRLVTLRKKYYVRSY
jgi:hypothetical protein